VQECDHIRTLLWAEREAANGQTLVGIVVADALIRTAGDRAAARGVVAMTSSSVSTLPSCI
jgi:hypothetical protein